MTVADLARRYDPDQHRGHHGRWADGAPGVSLDEYADMYDVYDESPTSSGLLVATMDNGEMQLALDDPEQPGRRRPLLDIDERDMLDVRHAVQHVLSAGGERELTDDDGVWLRVVDEGDGISVEIPDEEYSTVLDEDETGELLDALDEQLGRVDEVGRSGVLERRYNPLQKRDGDGQWSDGTPGQSARDALKLAGKIELAPDEKLLGSAKIDGDASGIRMALTEQNGERMLRLGAGGEGYGQRDREAGIRAWDGNPSPPPLSDADRKRLNDEDEALLEEEEAETASPARQDEIEARRQEIHEALVADRWGFNGTARLDVSGMERLASAIRPALAEAVERTKAEDDAYAEFERLEALGGADPGRLARLREIARLDTTDAVTFTEGILPGSAWGDVHYEVFLDEAPEGPQLMLGVWPKGAPDDWGDGQDWGGQFDAAETRKFLRLLDKMSSGDASRAYSQEAGPKYQAPAGPPAGGQFAAGGGRVGAKGKKKPAPRRPAAHGTAKPAAPNLSFDGKSGTGYGVKGGDPRVRQLQAVLNRLGLADSSGAALVLDGKYGPRTTSSVKKLQKALGVAQDGKVTPELLKQATDLKQLPAKPARKPAAKKAATSARQAPARRAQVLAYLARALGEEHVYDDGVCVSCWLDRIDELTTALDELTMSRAFDSDAHPRNPKGAGGGRFRSNVDRLKDALKSHKAGGGKGDPFEEFDREQLRRVAKQRGIPLGRGEGRDSIAKKLTAHLGEDGKPPEPKPEPEVPAKKTAPRKRTAAAVPADKPAAPKRARKAAPKKAASTTDRRALASTVEHQSVTSERSLSGGAIGDTRLREYDDGTKTVWKSAPDYASASARHQADAEELSSLVAQSLGLHAPAVVRGDERTVHMSFVDDAKSTAELGNDDDLPGSDAGRMMGLLDLLISNSDRNTGNVLVPNDGSPAVPIDHGFAFRTLDRDPPGKPARALASPYTSPFYSAWNGTFTDNDLAPGDITEARRRLRRRRAEFGRLDRADWFEHMMARLDAIEPHAKGTTSRLPAEVR